MIDALSRRRFLAFDFRDRRAPGDHWIRVHRTAMACRFDVTLSSDDAGHVPEARAALDEADRIEAVLTVFRDFSVIADVNRRAAIEDVTVDEALFSLLARCRELHADTDGAFDATSTPLSRCWGFMRRDGRLPTDAEIECARASVGMEHVRLDCERRSVRFAVKGLELNFGAIGKGYALDCMAALMRERGAHRALLSAGRSSVLAMGGRGRGWQIDLRPRLASRCLARLWIRDGGVGTSGTGEQFFEVNGTRYGHVIDPRSGSPAAAGVLAASVIAGDAASADALSTAFLIGGRDLTERYCAAHPGTLAVLVLEGSTERTEVFGHYNGARLEKLT
jgi:FAD:protein FMN transferase